MHLLDSADDVSGWGRGAIDAAIRGIAEVHAVRGENDAAFEWLDRAYRQHDGGLAGMKSSLHLRGLASDPRWSAFLLKMGFDA